MEARRRILGWADAHPRAAIASVFAAALLIRLVAFALTHRTLPAGDEVELFVRAARGVLGPPIEDDAARAPGLLVFYEAVFRMFGVQVAVAKLANCVVSALTVLPIAVIGRRFGGDRVALASAIAVAVFPDYIAFSHFLWPAPLYILLVTTAVALLVAFADRRDRLAPIAFAGAGALLAASALVKESGLLFPPVAALWLAWRHREDRGQALRSGGLVAATAALVLLPWVIGLQRPDQPFALVTRTGYMNLFVGNHPRGHGVAMLEYPELAPTRLEAEQIAKQRAFAEIRRRMPLWPLEKIASEVPRFFTPTSFAVRRLWLPPDAPGGWGYRMSFPWLDRPVARAVAVAVVVLAYLITIGFGAAGLVLARRRDLSALFALFIASQIAPSIPTFAMSRFRLASMAFLLLGAASLCVNGRVDWRAASPRRRIAAGASAALLLGLAALDYGSVLESTGR